MLFRQKNGFTLLELIISCAILAILIIIGLPYFQDIMAKQEINKISHQILANIQLAKSHAAIQQSNVVICATQNQRSCQANQWQLGFIVFLDSNKNRQLDIQEQIIATELTNLKYGTLNWRGTLSIPSVTFQAPNGLPIGSNGSFYYCSTYNQPHYRFVLSNMGHVRIEYPRTC